MDAAEHELFTWPMFGEASRALAQEISDSGFRPNIILGVARGGLLPASTLSYALDVKNVFMVSVEFYTGVNQRLEMPIMLPPILNTVDIAGTDLLIADDVADTGETLRLVKDYCTEHVAEVRCAVLYEKPHSMVKCEYVWRRSARWIDFPWSSMPPVRLRHLVPQPTATDRT